MLRHAGVGRLAGRRTRPAFLPVAARGLFFALLVLTPLAPAQVTVEGLTNETVYSDSVSFRVVSAPGYDYSATLRGEPIPIEREVPVDVVVEVSQPQQYYQLIAQRQSQTTGAVQTTVIAFIVKASERADTEWGLRPWTPYPEVPSAAAEFAGSTLVIVTPAEFPMGLEVPVVALVRDGSGQRVGVNGLVEAAGFPAHPIRLLRGVGSGALPAPGAPGTLAYAPAIQGLATPRSITIEPSTAWTTVSGTIAASTSWPADSRIHITGNVTVAAGATLTVGAGSVVRVAPSRSIEVTGSLVVAGTLARPVVFTAEARETPWGGLLFRAATSRGDVTGAILTRSGADPQWFDNVSGSGSSHRREQPLVYLSNGAHVTMTDSFLVDGAGQAAHVEGSDLTLARCLVQKFTTAGQFNGGTVTFTDSAFVEFPSADAPFADADNDAMYLSSGTRTITNCLIGWTLDDGIDGGGGATGPMYIHGCWFEATYHEGFALTDNGYREFRDCVAINCGQGFECGYDAPQGDVERCLLTANGVGVRFGDNYDWTYEGSIDVASSLLLFNDRDVWSRAWDDWSEHNSRMVIQGNHLSVADPLFPSNIVWSPGAHSSLLVPFLPTPATAVGIGIALREGELDLAQLADGVPIRLSTFTTVPITVGYSVVTDLGIEEEGTLAFAPGESLKTLRPALPDPDLPRWARIRLSGPVGGELTGSSEALYVRYRALTLLPTGSRWRYSSGAGDLGAAWRASGFNDASWPEGAAELGNGDGDEATAINIGPSGSRFPTVYFRASFELPDSSWITSLAVRLKRDDGAIVYLNGIEALRQNMPAGPVSYGTWAAGVVSDAAEAPFYPGEIDPSLLVAGKNVIAVEVHQSDAGSSDLSFDLELVARGPVQAAGLFVRGDANGDSTIDISDGIRILLVLFGGVESLCDDANDANDDGANNITDAVHVLRFLFQGGPPPAAPFPLAGEDPTPDALACGG